MLFAPGTTSPSWNIDFRYMSKGSSGDASFLSPVTRVSENLLKTSLSVTPCYTGAFLINRGEKLGVLVLSLTDRGKVEKIGFKRLKICTYRS